MSYLGIDDFGFTIHQTSGQHIGFTGAVPGGLGLAYTDLIEMLPQVTNKLLKTGTLEAFEQQNPPPSRWIS